MNTDRNGANRPITQNSICVQCGRNHPKLRRCCLTGMGDHPRHILLCGECVQKMIAKSPRVEHPHPPASSVMSEEEKRYETRQQKAFDRLGTDHPVCACCPETDWRCMELHHLESKEFGKTLVIVCRNCHRKLSDAQKDHPAKMGEPPMTLESIGQFLLGLADLLLLLADKLCECGEHLLEQARSQAVKKKPSQS